MMVRSSLQDARAFLLEACRIAVVGVSRDPGDFSRYLLRELLHRGRDAVPVNPALSAAEGVRAFARVSDVEPSPDSAILLVPAASAEEVVGDCLRARVRRIWCHRGSGPGVCSEALLALCAANRVEVVHGLCPFMAFQGAALPHRLHALARRALAHEVPRGHLCGLV